MRNAARGLTTPIAHQPQPPLSLSRQEDARVASLVKLRALTDGGARCTSGAIRAVFASREREDRRPAVEFHSSSVASPHEGSRKRGKRRRKEEGLVGGMRCSGAVVAAVCVGLPQELWVELMELWGPAHFHMGY